MNGDTKKIMELLGVDAEVAMRVQDAMFCDLSECSRSEFNRAAKEAYSYLKSEGQIN